MHHLPTRNYLAAATVAIVATVFVTGIAHDLRALARDLDQRHRMTTCLGIQEMKGSISAEDPRAICQRVVAASVNLDGE